MVHYEINGNRVFIDNKLKEKIDRKVIPDLKRKDMDAVYVVDGRERIGKSVFAMGLGGYIATQLGTEFGLSNICMNPIEFRHKIMTCPDKSVVIYDEAHRGMASARALSEINKILKDLMMEMGQKNLFVLIVLPTFFLLDRYAALFRTRGLFHIYRRGYWAYFNEKLKQVLYMKGKKEFNYGSVKWGHFRGRFFNQYSINEDEYREKKTKSFKESPKITRAEQITKQRDVLIYHLHKKYKLSSPEIEKLFKKYKTALKQRRIREIYFEIQEKYEKMGVGRLQI